MLKVFKLSSIPKFNQVRKVLKFFSTETKSMTPEQYEKEWTEIYLNKRNERFNYLESVLSEEEKKEVIGLLTKIVNLNEDEKTYYKYLLHSSLGEDVQQDSLSPSTYIKLENTWPKTNKNWHQSRNMQSALNTFSGNQDAVVATEQALTGGDKAAKTEAASEVKQEKSEYDIKLASYDQAKKISLIKEIRTLLNLGLKESKEVVEKAPCDIMKKIKKDQAEEIKAKLSEFGAVIELH